MSLWGVPDGIVNAIASHHTDEYVDDATVTVSMGVYIANILAHQCSPVSTMHDTCGFTAEALQKPLYQQNLERWNSLALQTVEQQGELDEFIR